MKQAPVAIFAFKRLDVLERTLSALELCDGFAETPLFVFSDAPRPGMHQEIEDVQRVRKTLRAWADRHGAELRLAETNKGLRLSITDGVTSVLNVYDRIIVLEDDIVASRGFLRFMNGALEAYENRAEIVQVSGYFVPHRRNLPTIGLLRLPSCWGWGTWSRAWAHYSDDAPALLAKVEEKDPSRFDMENSYGYLDALRRNAEGAIDTWLVRWYASVYLLDGLSVYPSRSLTRNIGFVEGGTNCGPGRTSRTFLRQPIDAGYRNVDWTAVGRTESVQFANALEAFYRWQQAEWGRPTWRERLDARWQMILGNTRTR